LYGAMGTQKSIRDVLHTSLPWSGAKNCLVVGDSLSDCKAARSMGAHFAGVRTRILGPHAQHRGDRLGTEFVLDEVTDLRRII